jgi:LmbE family N-acetylglucosaminyl deacetylase
MVIAASSVEPCDSVYLSPHGDDALLSCAARLLSEAGGGQSVLLVSVFAAPGSAGEAPALDHALASGLRIRHLSLGIPEARRRNSFYASFRSLAYGRHPEDETWLRDAVEALDEVGHRSRARQVYVPLGVGGHIDHRLCHEAALRSLRSGDGRNVFLYEERPEALVPGAVRMRLGELGARLPPAASQAAEPAGLARFLMRFHVPPAFRGELRGWADVLRAAPPAARQWRKARAWRPQKGFGPRLQPVVHGVDGEDLSAVRALVAAQPGRSRRSARRVEKMAAAYARRLGREDYAERYWLLLPPRESDGEVPLSRLGEQELAS